MIMSSPVLSTLFREVVIVASAAVRYAEDTDVEYGKEYAVSSSFPSAWNEQSLQI